MLIFHPAAAVILGPVDLIEVLSGAAIGQPQEYLFADVKFVLGGVDRNLKDNGMLDRGWGLS
jgi:hypothetical protein